jgi:hypothetical protein
MNGTSIVAYTVEPTMPNITASTRSTVVPGIISNNLFALTDMRTKTALNGVWMQSVSEYGNTMGAAVNGPISNMNTYNNNATLGNVGQLYYTTGPNLLRVKWFGPSYRGRVMSETNGADKWKVQQVYPSTGVTEAIISKSTIIAPSITKDITGPFLMFELTYLEDKFVFTDLRLPGVMSLFSGPSSTFTPTASTFKPPKEAFDAPGINGYMTMNVERPMSITQVYINAIAQMTYIFRFKSISVGNYEFLSMFGTDDNNNPYGFDTIITRNGNDKVNVQYAPYLNLASSKFGSPVIHSIGKWYMGVFTNNITSWNLSVNELTDAQSTTTDWTNKSSSITFTRSDMSMVSSRPNKSMEINFGRIYQNPGLVVDLAWVHMFDKRLSGADLQREAKNDWMFTTAQT